MKVVYLIRHAKSSWANPGLEDIERPLNKRGERDSAFMPNVLKGKGAKPDLIVSSPANRAFTTACKFGEAFGIDKDNILVREDIYEAYPQAVLEVIKALNHQANEVLIFGHNPTFTSLADMFSDEYIVNVPTCGIIKIEAEIDDWNLFSEENAKQTAFYFPKQYL